MCRNSSCAASRRLRAGPPAARLRPLLRKLKQTTMPAASRFAGCSRSWDRGTVIEYHPVCSSRYRQMLDARLHAFCTWAPMPRMILRILSTMNRRIRHRCDRPFAVPGWTSRCAWPHRSSLRQPPFQECLPRWRQATRGWVWLAWLAWLQHGICPGLRASGLPHPRCLKRCR